MLLKLEALLSSAKYDFILLWEVKEHEDAR